MTASLCTAAAAIAAPAAHAENVSILIRAGGCTTTAALIDASGAIGAYALTGCKASSPVRTVSVSIVENDRTLVARTEKLVGTTGDARVLTDLRTVGRRYKVCFVLARAPFTWPIILGPPDPQLWVASGCTREIRALG